ncbi:hypothetical protein [Candidatus Magnetominusculus xianensis]|uniref:DNA-binding protein n=1 Tax=Candidatus Magnetominusculus xianensis TaxID=1748249 RepID=A0ABR5SGT4_9BACT|nr:hypothetical protein [Candidatus Magnetominusculus xianensis]KWT90911.1 putative DNA-binding protein [Candidatus Magnetominusculus xianensis]MBF0403066.1 hypothetical protein [Nitrospirota bacterium]
MRDHIEIMCTFVRLRQMLASNADLARKHDNIEKKYDTPFKLVFDVIRELMKQQQIKGRHIGFRRENEGK